MEKKVTLQGVEFTVLSDADLLRARTAETKTIQACMRVADADPTPISPAHAERRQQLPCETCGELCWFDPKAGPGRLFVRLICIECLLTEVQS